MTIRMKAPEGLASISIDGKMFPIDGGTLIIPRELVKFATEHGFVVMEDEKSEAFASDKKVQKINTKKAD